VSDLTVEDVAEITRAVALGLELDLDTDEAKAMAAQIAKEIEEIRAAGYVVDIPRELPRTDEDQKASAKDQSGSTGEQKKAIGMNTFQAGSGGILVKPETYEQRKTRKILKSLRECRKSLEAKMRKIEHPGVRHYGELFHEKLYQHESMLEGMMSSLYPESVEEDQGKCPGFEEEETCPCEEAQKKSTECGANAPGGGGFQPGNTCAGEGGGGGDDGGAASLDKKEGETDLDWLTRIVDVAQAEGIEMVDAAFGTDQTSDKKMAESAIQWIEERRAARETGTSGGASPGATMEDGRISLPRDPGHFHPNADLTKYSDGEVAFMYKQVEMDMKEHKESMKDENGEYSEEDVAANEKLLDYQQAMETLKGSLGTRGIPLGEIAWYADHVTLSPGSGDGETEPAGSDIETNEAEQSLFEFDDGARQEAPASDAAERYDQWNDSRIENERSQREAESRALRSEEESTIAEYQEASAAVESASSPEERASAEERLAAIEPKYKATEDARTNTSRVLTKEEESRGSELVAISPYKGQASVIVEGGGSYEPESWDEVDYDTQSSVRDSYRDYIANDAGFFEGERESYRDFVDNDDDRLTEIIDRYIEDEGIGTDDEGEDVSDDLRDQLLSEYHDGSGDHYSAISDKVDEVVESYLEENIGEMADSYMDNVDDDELFRYAKDGGMLENSSGGDVDEDDLAGLGIDSQTASLMAGANDEADVRIEVDGEEIHVEVNHPHIRSQNRTIKHDDNGDLMIYNDDLFVQKGAPAGLGAKIFQTMVANARENDVQYFKTFAAKGHGMVGYNVWARFGYSFPVARMSDDLQTKIAAEFPEAEDVQDIMETKRGRDWWLANGEGMNGAIFDLTDGSRSMEIWKRYLLEKEADEKAGRTKTREQRTKEKESQSQQRSYRRGVSAKKKSGSNCGANAPGGGGFQPGNDCAGGDGGGGKSDPTNTSRKLTKAEEKHAKELIERSPYDVPDEILVYGNAENRKRWKEDHGITPEVAAQLAGAHSEAEVKVFYNNTSVEIDVMHPNIEGQRREILLDGNGELYLKAHELFVYPSAAGKGIGADVFATMVSNARSAGVQYFKTDAAKGDRMVGYSVWPRFGYSARVDLLPPDLQNDIYEKFGDDVEDVLDIMETKEGRDWWFDNGDWLNDCVFDLSDGSRSMEVWKRYLLEKDAIASGK
jgi:GNAT superfamily N-acetyltransferase